MIRRRSTFAAATSGLLLFSLLAQPATMRAQTSVPSTDPTAPAASTMFGDRRIWVPSGGHEWGSQLQVMSSNLGHVAVISNSNLEVDPEDDDGISGGTFVLVAGNVVRVDCEGCNGISAISRFGDAYVTGTIVSLVPEDLDTTHDSYLIDSDGPHLIDPAGKVESISDDAAYLVMSTTVKLLPADTDSTRDFYRWSRDADEIELITPGAFTPQLRAVSPDGTRILFETGENIGIPGGDPSEESIYEWTANGINRRGFGTFLSVSDDWTRVYMETNLSLDPVDDDLVTDGYVSEAGDFTVLTEPSAQIASLGQVNEAGSSWLIGTSESLDPSDTDGTGDIYLGSTGSSPVLLTAGAFGPDNFVMDASFTSGIYATASQLDAGDTDELGDVYRWSAADPSSPELLTGEAANGHVSVLAYAADGSRAFLASIGQLIPEDADSFMDVYEYVDGELALVLPGDQSYDVEGWTPDLQRIVVTAGDLSEEDTNGNIEDVYISDADFTAPTVTILPPGITGPNPTIEFGTEAGDGAGFTCQVDGAAAVPCAPGVQLGPLVGGPHTIDIVGYDAAGNQDSASVAWTVDATAPNATAPADAFVTGSTVNSGATSVKFTWSATDGGAGVAAHEIAVSVNGGPFVTRSASLESPTFTMGVLKGKSYQARIRSVDAVGNVSSWKVGPAFHVVVVQESSDSITRSGTWKKVETENAWGGSMRWSATHGDRLRLTFGGRSLAIIGRIGANEGIAKIFVDGELVKKVNLRNATTANRRVVFATTWSTDEVRTIEIRVAGTDGHPRVYVDAVVIGT